CPDMISFFNKAREKKAAAATSNDEVKALGIGVYKTESKIILTENERTSYVLLDITGKIVGQGVVDDEGINIEYLPYGVYILRLGNGLIYKFFK
ncbi:MAG: hypothetical protein J6S89_06240, partial [Paludibacteraceae bacterium]|nr:hypothetical protein [Paludibacteraceae bacterium]